MAGCKTNELKIFLKFLVAAIIVTFRKFGIVSICGLDLVSLHETFLSSVVSALSPCLHIFLSDLQWASISITAIGQRIISYSKTRLDSLLRNINKCHI